MLALCNCKWKNCNLAHQFFVHGIHSSVIVACELSTVPEVEGIVRTINDHPFLRQPLCRTLVQHLSRSSISSALVENVLGRLFATHSNGLKALEFFRFCLRHSHSKPTSKAFETTLHILARMRYFQQAWELMEEIGSSYPSVLTLKSMSILLCKVAKYKSYEETLDAFERLEKIIFVGRKFNTDEFNVLLRAFCTQRQMKEARSVFSKMIDRFSPNTKTMDILLLGFKESRDLSAMELFYHEIVARGFKPTISTYNTRIDAYCKKGYFLDGVRIFEEMQRANSTPILETITTLIHGAGIVRNHLKAQQFFDELSTRHLDPDTAAYNALISAFIRCRQVDSAMRLMEEMQEKQIGHDDVTYRMIFLGLKNTSRMEDLYGFYHSMIHKNFVPKTRTVVMLVKFFCLNGQLDLGCDFWRYLMGRGFCPHAHALDLLVVGLCSRARVEEAFECTKQFLERGMRISESTYRMLERLLLQLSEISKLKELHRLIRKLLSVLPSSAEHLMKI